MVSWLALGLCFAGGPAGAFGQKKKQIQEQKPGFNLFSKDQDIQLGKESAAEVEKQVVVVNNPEVTQYLNLVGGKLAKSKRANEFPYYFKLVNDDSINAFALPGGPMYVHTGLIKAAENEAQLAGVLAHEMSHVALRHGTNQASKQNLLQIPLALGGAMAGNGMLGQLTQLGIGLGANSVLMKFSRNAESQADYNGALMMSDAGYNPVEMARFFEKLEAQSGKSSKVAAFFSSHPSPGNRVKATEELVTLMPQQNYNGDTGQFEHIKAIVSGIPAAPKKELQQQQGNGQVTGTPAQVRPSGRTRDFRNAAVSMRYPDNWDVMGDSNGNAITIAPKAAVAGSAISYGLIQSFYSPQNASDINLQRDTQALIGQLQQGDPKMKVTQQSNATIGGVRGLATVLQTGSGYANETETDLLITAPHRDGLFYIVVVAPSSEWQAAKSQFEDIVRSVQFVNR
ncbi:MAG: M48 family metalloprotease [Acidobacteria bacterium]|nr:M48 family metalloprotease [Acidobacteriota bacterium]